VSNWEKEADRSSVLLAALAKRYSELGKIDQGQPPTEKRRGPYALAAADTWPA